MLCKLHLIFKERAEREANHLTVCGESIVCLNAFRFPRDRNVASSFEATFAFACGSGVGFAGHFFDGLGALACFFL